MLVIIGSVGIHPTRSPVSELEVDVTTYVQTVGIVVLSFTEIQEITLAVVAHVGIELCKLTTTFELSRHIVARLGLLEIIRIIELLVWITVRIGTCSRVIDVFSRIFSRKTIVGKCLIVKCHILRTIEVGRIRLRYTHLIVGTGCNLQRFNLTTLCCDEDGTLCSTATVENNGRSTLEEGNVFNLRWQNIVCITWHTVNQHKCITLIP